MIVVNKIAPTVALEMEFAKIGNVHVLKDGKALIALINHAIKNA